MVIQGFALSSIQGNGYDTYEANMSPSGRIWLTVGSTIFYFTWAYISMKCAPEPQKLEKGKWVRMAEPDYSAHYLEWVSIVHAIISVTIGSYIAYQYGFHYNRKTLYWEYMTVWNSLGYFIYDSAVEWYFNTFDLGIMAHHMAAISWTGATLYEHYGGCAMFNGLYLAEISGPCFITRCAWKRQNLEHTYKYHLMVWAYSSLYYMSRGVGYSISLIPIATSLRIPFYLKCMFIPALFISFGWLLMISAMLWKSIPNWSATPQKIKQKEWWITGRRLFKRYTKDSPMIYVTICIFATLTWVIPISIAFMGHYVDSSWGTYD